MSATAMQPNPLKAACLAILQRNQPRNRSATDAKDQCNSDAQKQPEKLRQLQGRLPVAQLHSTRVQPCNSEWRLTPRAWIKDGELRTIGVFPDLAAEIKRLTEGNPELRDRLLHCHCETWRNRDALMRKER